MRNSFAQTLLEIGREDPQVVLLAADIGNRLFDDFKVQCPGRFFNCGVAEANMIGVAAGMAMCGLKPVCYTIASFITYRCLEQIRLDLCYHRTPVVLVGTGSGLSYASLGPTHHSCEEMGMLRLLPHLAVVAPADSLELRAALKCALQYRDPVYLRIGKKGEPQIHDREPSLVIGRALALREGGPICFLGAGTILPAVLEAADLLARDGLPPAVYSFHTIKPLDEGVLKLVFGRHTLVITVEEHNVAGGLGGSVAEWLSNSATARARLLRLGTGDEFLHESADQSRSRRHYGLTAVQIAIRAKAALAEGKPSI